jgi:hypothetical protein
MTEATMTPTAGASLAALVAGSDVGREALAAHLDALSPAERVEQCRALSGRQMKRLYELAEGSTLLPEDFVPASVAPGTTVRFAGKNSLPLFAVFEKHFARHEGQVVGMNLHAITWATGPGYFVLRPAEGRPGEILFDYNQVPASAPSGWPVPRGNAGGISRFVFKDLHDFNRRVSEGVIIGSAWRGDRPINSYYIIARLP